MSSVVTYKLTIMKNLILLLSGFCFINTSCSSNDRNNDQELINSLIGEWEEVAPCESCSVVTFEENNFISLQYDSDLEIYRMTYTLENNSMQVNRLWDVGEEKESNLVTISFSATNNLQLSQFYVTDANSVTGFIDVVLKKL